MPEVLADHIKHYFVNLNKHIQIWLSSGNFFQGGESIVILLFSDQISGRGKSFQGDKLPRGGRPPCPPVEESQQIMKISLKSEGEAYARRSIFV